MTWRNLSISILFLPFLLSLYPLYGQSGRELFEVNGQVLDSESNLPLPGVHVFLDQTLMGTSTDRDGRFTIKGVPKGTYRLVASMIGYELVASDLDIPEMASSRFLIRLPPQIVELPEIVVKAERSEDWFDHLERFTEAFLGYSERAAESELLNPEILNFRKDGGHLIVETGHNPLKIVNKALGYEIDFYLNRVILDEERLDTYGFTHYRELTASSEREKRRWEDRRRRAYHGSFRHFVRALADDSLEEDGFHLFYSDSDDDVRRNRLIIRVVRRDSLERKIHSPGELMKPSGDSDLIHLSNPRSRYIGVIFTEGETDWRNSRFMRSRLPWQISLIELPEGIAVLDRETGNHRLPYRPILKGYWAWTTRIADLLPDDFDLNGVD